jgi:ribosomal-protein-alanine N-acetyltransferase
MTLRKATASDCALFAALHAASFDDPWSAEAFAALLGTPGTAAYLAEANAEAAGFILVREAGGEAEILSLGVKPEARRQGLARSLVQAAAKAILANGSQILFLEVAADNLAARALYVSLGFAEVGRRPAYYTKPGAPARDALILKVRLPLEAARMGICRQLD